MEKEKGTWRTKKDLEIAKLKNGITLHEMSIDHSKSIIEVYKKELKELTNEKPKLSAADFPCLDFHGGKIHFNDGKNSYLITKDLKKIEKSPRCLEEIIDENVEIVECQLSEIKPGDYFQYPLRDAKKINSYFYYHTYAPERKYPKMVYWAECELILMNSLCTESNEVTVYKFIIRN